jgi:hypothetical protein
MVEGIYILNICRGEDKIIGSQREAIKALEFRL